MIPKKPALGLDPRVEAGLRKKIRLKREISALIRFNRIKA
jgi:hypothetical protein